MQLTEAIEKLKQGVEIEGLRLSQDGEVLVVDNGFGLKLNNWKIKEEKREITSSDIENAILGCIRTHRECMNDGYGLRSEIKQEAIMLIKKELGFK